MKNKFGRFAFLLALLSACGTPVVTEPVEQVQRTQTPSPIFTLTPSLRPTSTVDVIQQASGGFPFCQIAPREAFLGSSVNISAFRLPRNHPISIFIYGDNRTIQLPNTALTDGNGYVNVDIVLPMNLSTEDWNRIALIPEGSPQTEASCMIRPWTESSLATHDAWLSRTPTATVPPEQAAMTATQQALKDRLGANCYYHSAQGIRLSPNSQWAEAICDPYSIIIIRMDGTKEWGLSSDSLIAPYTEHFVYLSHWSIDGAYAYVVANPHTDGYWEFFHQGFVLYRLTLETGQVSEVLPLVKSNWRFYSFAFSPNDRRLAYIVTDKSPVILNIRDMQTGDEQSFEFDPKYNTGGGFLWSPDSQKLIFSITQHDSSVYKDIATSIVLWDKDKPDITMLIKDHEEILVPVEWIDETRLILQVLNKEEIRFEFDMISGELKQVSP